MKRAGALASHPAAHDAAFDHLQNGGSALGAVLAGFFAAAGMLPGVLLSPLTVLVGGIGVGARAFDGRLRQPGLGAKRPRGFLSDEPIPNAARVAVPGIVAAVVAQAYDQRSSLAAVARTGVALAKRTGSTARAEVLSDLVSAGGRFLSTPRIQRALLALGGPGEGGLLSPADLSANHEIDIAARERQGVDQRILEAPWHDDVAATHGVEAHAVIAIDAHGVCAGVAFGNAAPGLALADLELDVPTAAIPVQRGVTRTRPGDALAAAAPLAVILDGQGVPLEIVATSGSADGARRLTLRRSKSGLVEPLR